MNTSAGLSARVWNGVNIARRDLDGYVNATAMCQANGKRWFHYHSNDRSQAYIAALAADAGIPASELIHSIKGGRPEFQGTWIHPRLAVDLARWISPSFAVWMDRWFLESIGFNPEPSKAKATRSMVSTRLERMDGLYQAARNLVAKQEWDDANLQAEPYYRYILMDVCLSLMAEMHGERLGVTDNKRIHG